MLEVGTLINGVEVIGDESKLEYFFNNGYRNAFISLGSIGNTEKRRRIYCKLKSIGFTIPTIIDSTANLSILTEIGEGVFIGKNAIINTNSKIGLCCIINSGAIIEHDCEVDEFVHVSPGTVLNGFVKVGSDTHIGSNSTIKNGLFIGSHTIIGIGSVVVNNIGSNTIAYGNPCREVNK